MTWGLKFDNQLHSFEGRTLPAEKIRQRDKLVSFPCHFEINTSGGFKGGGAHGTRPLYFWQNLVKSAHFPPIWPRHPLFSVNLASALPLSENSGSAPEHCVDTR